jgi:hypothetical protein
MQILTSYDKIETSITEGATDYGCDTVIIRIEKYSKAYDLEGSGGVSVDLL